MFRKVIVSRARRTSTSRGGRSVRRLARETPGLGDCSTHLPVGLDAAPRPLRPGRIVALVVGILALLLSEGQGTKLGVIEWHFSGIPGAVQGAT